MFSSTDPPFGSTFRPWTLSVWKTWLNSMSPERLAQQRAYDRERGKQYHQDHKEVQNKKNKNTTKTTKNACARSMYVRLVVVGTPPAKRHNTVRPKNIRLHCKVSRQSEALFEEGGFGLR